MENYLHIILSTSAVYFFILITLRLLGKSELAQLTITDLIFVLLISNAVQNAMVGSDTSLTGGLIAASVLFLLNFIFKRTKHKFPYFNPESTLEFYYKHKSVILEVDGNISVISNQYKHQSRRKIKKRILI